MKEPSFEDMSESALVAAAHWLESWSQFERSVEGGVRLAHYTREAWLEIKRLRELVEAAYREGFDHGESAGADYEWGSRGREGKNWDSSEAKEALEQGGIKRPA